MKKLSEVKILIVDTDAWEKKKSVFVAFAFNKAYY